MQPTLHARESIHHINEMSYAFGSMKKEDGNSFIAELNRLARGDKGEPALRPKSIEQMERLMGGLTKIER